MVNDTNDQLKQVLALVRQSVSPDRLNTIQESVFSGCWLGQTYQEIANDLGYDAVYIRGVGSNLWQQLSKSFGEKITKSNFQTILQQRLEQGDHFSARSPKTTYAEAAPSRQSAEVEEKHPRIPSPTGFADQQAECASLLPGARRPERDDNYYVLRPPNEERCHSKINQQGALIRIKAPQQMGKTSLMTRLLSHAKNQHFHAVVVSLRLADAGIFTNLDRFLQWFCAIVDDQLDLESALEKHWKPIFGSNYNCTHYIGHTVLPSLSEPVVIALDDVDVLFEHPTIATDFLGLLRAWCEKAQHSDRATDAWWKLRLVVVHSTEVYIPLHQHQSPFNIGLSIELPEFNAAQILDLANRYGVSWTADDIKALMALIDHFWESIGHARAMVCQPSIRVNAGLWVGT
ncbi:MAG: AAA-like domain-containing protein [Cyanobacteria bacterium P01_F01_bin.150]